MLVHILWYFKFEKFVNKLNLYLNKRRLCAMIEYFLIIHFRKFISGEINSKLEKYT